VETLSFTVKQSSTIEIDVNLKRNKPETGTQSTMKNEIHDSAINLTEQELEQNNSPELDEVMAYSKQRVEQEPVYGVVSSVLMFDEAHAMFCIAHPFEEDYAIPVSQTIVDIGREHTGSEVLLSFIEGDIFRPVITGIIQALELESIEYETKDKQRTSVKLDDQEKLIFEADKEIVLKCGKSSITLTRAGKVLICGAYVLSRSSGVNKIKGGSVQLN